MCCCGFFGRRKGLLAEMEVEEEHETPVEIISHQVIENNVDQKVWDFSPAVKKQQDSCVNSVNLNNFTDQVQNLNLLASKTTQPLLDIIPQRDSSPIEVALSYEKISETIFSLLEPSDLLQCRLVSSSWLQMATNDKLLKSNKNALRITYNLEDQDPLAVTVKGRAKQLKEVSHFLDDLGSHPCLYSAELILKTTIAPNYFFSFLDRYGFVVTSLKVTFQAKENCKDFVYHMNSLLEFVTNLLTEQMPNLESLEMEFEKNAKFEGKVDPQLLVSLKQGLHLSTRHNQNLRTIKLSKQVSHKITETACYLAPKLKELEVNDFKFWAKNKCRWNLLKTLEFIPSLEFWDEVDALEAIVGAKEKVNLEKLSIDFVWVRDNPEVWPRLATLVTKTLEKCSYSLKQLKLESVYFLPGTVFPRMPNVKVVSLLHGDYDKSGWSPLPQGFSFVATFPNLHTIYLNGIFDIAQFLTLCKNEEVASVKRIFVFDGDFSVNEVFQERFPNAIIAKRLVGIPLF